MPFLNGTRSSTCCCANTGTLDNANGFVRQVIERRGATPREVITDGHQAYQRVAREEAPEAVHIATGLHGAPGHLTTQPIEHSHMPAKDRVRPMHRLQSIATGQ